MGNRTAARVCLVLCWLCVALDASAALHTYERTFERLSQAVKAHRSLAEQMPPYDAVFRRDPMQALINDSGELVSSSGLHGGYSVQGIIWSGASPLAVIDDELYVQGDTVGPYTIRQVLPEGVIVQRGNDTLWIPLNRGLETPPERVVKPPPTAPR